MTKAQIKAELRRSACEDWYPIIGLAQAAYVEVVDFSDWPRKNAFHENNNDLRTFFLLVAEAL